MFVADRVGLIALIASGYRLLAYIFLAVFVLPLMTLGAGATAPAPSPFPPGDRRMKLRHLLALPLLALATPALADPPGGLDAKIEALRKASGAPGIAVAIVENGKTTLAKGWGYRKLGDRPGSMPTRSSRPDRPARRSPPPRSPSWSIRARSAGTTR
jgi:CubicO group peptidase (beta-lactamase class C family)